MSVYKLGGRRGRWRTLLLKELLPIPIAIPVEEIPRIALPEPSRVESNMFLSKTMVFKKQSDELSMKFE